MKIGKMTLAAAVAAAAVCGCSSPGRRTGNPAVIVQAPSLSEELSKLTALPPPAALKALPPLPAMPALAAMPPLEPALCARLAAAGEPKFDAQELGCIVSWMREAQDYLAQGGAPTKYTNEKEFNDDKKTALDMLAAQTKWLTDARFTAEAAPVVPVRNPASESQDLYLSGVIDFQKGDNAQARAAWSEALKADPSNSDAKAGLELLDKRGE